LDNPAQSLWIVAFADPPAWRMYVALDGTFVALAAAEAIFDTGRDVAPANHVVEGPADGLL
jgi:hypothetical protein